MNNPETRKGWDKGPKDFINLQGDDENSVFRLCYHSPFFLISERDCVDKRIQFYHEGLSYDFSSSVDEGVRILF